MIRKASLLVALAAVAALAGCSKKEVRQEPTSEVFRETSTVKEGTVAVVEQNRVLLWDAQDPSGQPVALDLTDDTTYVKEGDFVDRNEIEEGGAVRVFYDETQEHPEALRVEILSGNEADQVKKRVEDVVKPND